MRPITDPLDPALASLSRLMLALFADPDVVLPLDRLQAFLAEPDGTTGRVFRVLVEEHDGLVLGGTVFSYVPDSNCGFSEYLVVRKDRHGQGIGRRLVDARRAELDSLARRADQAACNGLFIEADNPHRMPADLQVRERATGMDSVTRLELFAHLGFFRADMAYIQPPLAPDQQPVDYLDLLFAPWSATAQATGRVPADWVARTVGPIWDNWAPSAAGPWAEALGARIGAEPIHLLALV